MYLYQNSPTGFVSLYLDLQIPQNTHFIYFNSKQTTSPLMLPVARVLCSSVRVRARASSDALLAEC